VFQKKVNAIIAMETSAARNTALPIVARGKVPYIYTSFYKRRSCGPWMLVNGLGAGAAGGAGRRLLRQEQGREGLLPRSVAIARSAAACSLHEEPQGLAAVKHDTICNLVDS
jgi:hypothetical protein